MPKPLFAFALCSMSAACAAPQTVDRQPVSAASETPAAKTGTTAKRVVCVEEQVEDTGTRLGSRKVCRPVDDTDKAPS